MSRSFRELAKGKGFGYFSSHVAPSFRNSGWATRADGSPALIEKFSKAATANSKSKTQENEVTTPLKPYEGLKELKDPNFCPAKDSPQAKGQRMPFSLLARALIIIEET